MRKIIFSTCYKKKVFPKTRVIIYSSVGKLVIETGDGYFSRNSVLQSI